MSSTNIHISGDLISKSLIIKTNNHGPSLVPCGTPKGTGPHSEKQPSANLMRWNLSERKSMIQFTTLRGMSSLHSLSIKILWSIKSNALRKSNNIVLTVAPFPSVPRDYAWSCLSGPWWLMTLGSPRAGFHESRPEQLV